MKHHRLRKSASHAHLKQSENQLHSSSESFSLTSTNTLPSRPKIRKSLSSHFSTVPTNFSKSFGTPEMPSIKPPFFGSAQEQLPLSVSSLPSPSFLEKQPKRRIDYFKHNKKKPHLRLQRPLKDLTISTSSSDKLADNSMPGFAEISGSSTPHSLPPPVTPYTLKNRRDKSLENKLWCICEERLEYTFDGERVIVLQCNDVCHVMCLKTYYIETLYMGHDEIEMLKIALETGADIDQLQQDGATVPRCPTCDDPAIPIDHSVFDTFDTLVHTPTNDSLIAISLGSNSILETDNQGNSYESAFDYGRQSSHFPESESSVAAAERSLINYMDECMPHEKPTKKNHILSAQKSIDSLRFHKRSASIQKSISPWNFDFTDSNYTPYSESPTLENQTNNTTTKSVLLHNTSTEDESFYSAKSAETSFLSLISNIKNPSLNQSPENSSKTPSATELSARFLTKYVDVTSSFSRKLLEPSESIPGFILKARQKRLKPPSIELVTETKNIHVTEDDTNDVYVTSFVSVKTPLQPTEFQSEEEGIKIRAQLTVHVKNSSQDWEKRKLEVSQFGNLRLHDRFFVSMDGNKWQFLDCYLFNKILIFIRTYTHDLDRHGKAPVLKGSVDIRNHLVGIELPSSSNITSPHKSSHDSQFSEHVMTLRLATDQLPILYLKTHDVISIENWYVALTDWNYKFPLTRLVPRDDLVGQSIASQTCVNEPDVYSSHSPTSYHIPSDAVILIPISDSQHESKISAIQHTIETIRSKMQLFDRISIVPYGQHLHPHLSLISNSSNSFLLPNRINYYELMGANWQGWSGVYEYLKTPGSYYSRADLFDGLNQALYILKNRKSQNPVSSIYVVSDSCDDEKFDSTAGFSDSLDSKYDLGPIAQTAMLSNVTINSVSISSKLLANDLKLLATKTKGVHYSLKDWSELCSVISGIYEKTQNISHSDVSLSIDTTSLFENAYATDQNGENVLASEIVTVSDISGNADSCEPICESTPLTSPSSPSGNRSEKPVPQECAQEHLIELGNMGFNQERKYLVRVRVQLKAVTAQNRLSYLRQLEKQPDTVGNNTLESFHNYEQYRELELFHLSLSYKTFTTSTMSTGTVFLLPVGRAVIPIKAYDIDLGSPVMNEYSQGFDSDSANPVADIEGCNMFEKNSWDASEVHSCYSNTTCSSSDSNLSNTKALLAFPPAGVISRQTSPLHTDRLSLL